MLTEALVKLTEDGLAEVGGTLFRALNHFCSCMLTYLLSEGLAYIIVEKYQVLAYLVDIVYDSLAYVVVHRNSSS